MVSFFAIFSEKLASRSIAAATDSDGVLVEANQFTTPR
jgi:hypothetical protein